MENHTKDPTVNPPPPGQNPTGWRSDDRWEHATLRKATLYGVQLFNGGKYHESHDCFEHEWYNYGTGTVESAFLHGMVQVAAGALKYIDHDNKHGMQSLFNTARMYLHDTPNDFYGIDLLDIKIKLTNAQATPDIITDWHLTIDGETPPPTPDAWAYVRELHRM